MLELRPLFLEVVECHPLWVDDRETIVAIFQTRISPNWLPNDFREVFGKWCVNVVGVPPLMMMRCTNRRCMETRNQGHARLRVWGVETSVQRYTDQKSWMKTRTIQMALWLPFSRCRQDELEPGGKPFEDQYSKKWSYHADCSWNPLNMVVEIGQE